MADDPREGGRPTGASTTVDPQDASYMALHSERGLLERELTLAQQKQRFGATPQDVALARAKEESLLRDLDRVLTLIRAAEVRRKPGPGARRWQ